jgi:hypothetical protein
MDMLILVILVSLTTVAIPALTETATATHIFDVWVRFVAFRARPDSVCVRD